MTKLHQNFLLKALGYDIFYSISFFKIWIAHTRKCWSWKQIMELVMQDLCEVKLQGKHEKPQPSMWAALWCPSGSLSGPNG